ncbi:MAG: hypothetical protein JWN02_1824 [Acidobacteria bacterium]|nr:hypothetical protein [Acidobacteriota bacterium]
MLYMQRQKLENIEDLRTALSNAITLEFSTIPPYLTAYYSIKANENLEVGSILYGIFIDEMLHLALVCNILNAVGGKPDLPGSVAHYPGPLPMGIGTKPGGAPFIVPLKKVSVDVVRDVFMVIESPEHPLIFPEKRLAAAMADQYQTIGEFYAAVADLIDELGPSIFKGYDPARQVTSGYMPDLVEIPNAVAARAAIKLIVEQGEGSSKSPDPAGELAHYYQFKQIVMGKTLVPDPSVPEKHSWGPPPIVLDPGGVLPVVDNPGDVPLIPGSMTELAANASDDRFHEVVDQLQEAFGGNPGAITHSFRLMSGFGNEAHALMGMPIDSAHPEKGNAGPRYWYK